VKHDHGDVHAFSTTLVQWTSASHGTWHFIGVPPAIADVIDGVALMRRLETGRRAGFGSVKLVMCIGTARWSTSAFPLKDHGWSIPVSVKVRKALGLVAGDVVEASITV